MSLFLSPARAAVWLAALLASSAGSIPGSLSAQEQWQQFPTPLTMQFPDGFRVLRDAHRDAVVEKVVPGSAEATLKGHYRNAEGDLFYLSDWSWDRRMRGDSHFWIHPIPASKPTKPRPEVPAEPGMPQSSEQVYDKPRSLAFEHGFEVLDTPSQRGKILSTVPGPARADVRLERVAEGVRYYMSEWSWERSRRGLPGNWMRPFPDPSDPAAPGMRPPAPVGEPDLRWIERPHQRVFPDGYEVVAEPAAGATPVERVEGPLLLSLAAEGERFSEGVSERFFLTPEANEARRAGRAPTYLREPMPPPQKEHIPRMRELAGEAELRFEIEDYSTRPWQLSADLFAVDVTASLSALREFDVFQSLTEIANHYEDREFPLSWLLEVARHLEETGRLAESMRHLRDHEPRRREALRLYLLTEEAEMMPFYIEQNLQFDRRFLALLAAEAGDHATVVELLAPLLDDWDPDDDPLNASGPRMNILREVARSQWKLGRTDEARAATDRWLKLYLQDVIKALLHPDYHAASERVMEFDADFEEVGDYYELIEAITDPEAVAEILVKLKGLALTVSTSTQFRRSASTDPKIDRLTVELLALEEELRRSKLAGDPRDHDLEGKLSSLHARLLSDRLSGGAGIDFSALPRWVAISEEIVRRSAAGEESWELDELSRRRDLVAVEHLVASGGFLAELEDVVEALPEGAVLVDFYRAPTRTTGDEGRYGAVLLARETAPRLVDLGPANAIDGAVARYRAFMTGTGEFALLSLEELEKLADEVVASTYESVLAPLVPGLEGAAEVHFCPEGQLAFLPFDLLGPDARSPAHDRWQIGYLNAARDLVRIAPGTEIKGESPQAEDPTRRALLVGNPDFSGGAPPPAQGGTSPGGGDFDEGNLADLASASRSIEFGPLPGTQEEIDRLAPLLQSSGYTLRILSEGEATEKQFLEEVRAPTILHLATHGFFLERLPVLARRDSGVSPLSGSMLGGLALSGAQSTLEDWQSGIVPDPSRDGILFAGELARIDLSRTRLVVLSACDTGVGEVRSGEGVEGLRSALALAGAGHVLLTLWPIDDEATVEVMVRFYERFLEEEGDPAAALRETRSELFEQFATAHGHYLAHRFVGPFVMTRSR